MIYKNIFQPLMLSMLLVLPQIMRAYEGMWQLPGVPDSIFYDLEEHGCELDSAYFYDKQEFSLKDITMYLSNGYTATLMSKNGLLLTTYSAVEDYFTNADSLKNGFYAEQSEDEIPIDRLYALQLQDVKDLQEKINAAILPNDNALTIKHKKDSVCQMARLLAAAEPDIVCDIKTDITGHTLMYVYKRYSDLRLCYLPPKYLSEISSKSINGLATNHNADFALLRIYQPDEYGDAQAAQFDYCARIAVNPYSEGDFVFAVGYPGTSKRMMMSAELEEQINVNDSVKLQVMSFFDSLAANKASHSAECEAIREQNRHISKQNLIAKKKDKEQDFTIWAANNADFDKCLRYANVVPLSRLYYSERENAAKNYFGLNYILQYSNTLSAAQMIDEMTGENSIYILPQLSRYFRELDSDKEKNDLKAVISYIKQNCDSAYMPEIFAETEAAYKKKPDKYYDKLFAKSFLTDVVRFDKFLNSEKQNEDKDNDMLIQLSRSIAKARNKAFADYSENKQKLESFKSLYAEGCTVKDTLLTLKPEANYTYRMSVGKIEGYSPDDGIRVMPFTKASAVFGLSKAAQADSALAACKEDMQDLNANFLCSTDMAGKRMGYGVYDVRGDFIGMQHAVNADYSIYEYSYDERLSRSFTLDVYYVIFLLKHYSEAERLCEELSYGNKIQTVNIKYINHAKPPVFKTDSMLYAIADSVATDSSATDMKIPLIIDDATIISLPLDSANNTGMADTTLIMPADTIYRNTEVYNDSTKQED